MEEYNKLKRQQQFLAKQQFDQIFSRQLKQEDILKERIRRKKLQEKQKLKQEAEDKEAQIQKKYLKEREYQEYKEQ